MSSNKGKASTSSGKGGKKSTRKAAKLAMKAMRDKLRLDDLLEDPRSEIASRFGLEVEDLFDYDSMSDLSEDNYEKLASDYDLLLNDVELLEAKEKLWNSEREALQKQISLLKQEYESIQKNMKELETRLDAATTAALAAAKPSTNALTNATQAPDVIAPAITPTAESRNKKKKSKKKSAKSESSTAGKDSTTEEKEITTSDKEPSQEKSPKEETDNPATKNAVPKQGTKGQKKRTQTVIYVRPAQGLTFLDAYRALRGCEELLKEPLMIDRPRRVPDDVLMIPVKGSADSAVVEKLVRESIGDIGKVTMKTPMTTITCTHLGGSTTASDVQKVILDRHGVNVELGNVQLQKSRKGHAKQARIKLAVRDARKLDGRKLRIGTSAVIFQMEISKKVENERCFRCMGLGHMAHQCKETNSLCYRCLKDGHQASKCKNMPKCLNCDGGHQTGSRKCDKSSKTEVAPEKTSE